MKLINIRVPVSSRCKGWHTERDYFTLGRRCFCVVLNAQTYCNIFELRLRVGVTFVPDVE